MNDYVLDNQSLEPFFNYQPNISGFKKAIESRMFDDDKRQVIANILLEQYQGVDKNEEQLELIESLRDVSTYTVTTGHQLCLYTGPLYFVYKILSVVKLAKQLKKEFPNNRFVPIYWMASEDHDFEEINHFFLHNRKFSINSSSQGAVGEIAPEIDNLLSELEAELGVGKVANELFQLFKSSYSSSTLSEATFKLVHSLLGEFGIVILNPDAKELKLEFVSCMKSDLIDQLAHSAVTETSNNLSQIGYKAQVNPREINLFYLQPDQRTRIEKFDGGFRLIEGDKSWSEKEILDELDQFPERFSPNVILRPLYQEVILPNLSYTGGAGELSYWLQLKGMFDAFKVDFPILLLRNSMVILSKHNVTRLDKLGIEIQDLFTEISDLEDKLLKIHSNKQTELSEEKDSLKKVFLEIQELSKKINPSLTVSVEATETKALKLIDKLEKKLVRHDKLNHRTVLDQLYLVLDEVFPNGTFQERRSNFSEYYLKNGTSYFSEVYNNFEPLKPEISILKLSN